jgi:LPXTG-motif cell wall-anchored protein
METIDVLIRVTDAAQGSITPNTGDDTTALLGIIAAVLSVSAVVLFALRRNSTCGAHARTSHTTVTPAIALFACAAVLATSSVATAFMPGGGA